MSIEGIDVFIEVVDAQSFARAADRLGMPPTTVSAKIPRLERSLGVTLIQRTTRRLHVTPAGEVFYQRCVRALAELNEGKRELDAGKQEPVGVLRITAAADIAHCLLTPLVGRFLDLYPKASIDLIITNQMVDLVSERIDLALRSDVPEDSGLIIRKFRSARAGFWASHDYLASNGTPETPDELNDHQIIRFSRLAPNAVLKSSTGDVLRIEPTARLTSDDLENLRYLILNGYGIGVLPDFLAEDAASSAALVRVLPDYATEAGSVNFVYPSQKFVPQTVQAFLAIAAGAGSLSRANERGTGAE